MALTTVDITEGSGTPVAVDDAGAAGHVQVVKLARSTAGSATLLDADATGLEVQGAGVAGTPAGGVLTVQGVTSGTPVQVGDNAGSLTVDAPVATPVFVRLSDGSSAIATLPVSLASVPAHAVTITDPLGANADAAASVGGANSISAKLRLMTTQLDAIQTAVQTIDNAIAGSEMQVDIVSGAAAASPVSSVYHAVAGASTNVANIKASAGTLFHINVYNNADYPIYVKLHNTAGTPTAGSGVVYTVGVQAGVGREVTMPQGGRSFATGIGISIVKGIADNDATATVASDAVVDVIYG